MSNTIEIQKFYRPVKFIAHTVGCVYVGDDPREAFWFLMKYFNETKIEQRYIELNKNCNVLSRYDLFIDTIDEVSKLLNYLSDEENFDGVLKRRYELYDIEIILSEN